VGAAQRRIEAALGTLLALWQPPDGPSVQRELRAQVRGKWPALAAALDDLTLAVTARTAAELEVLAQLVPPGPCAASGTAVSGPVRLSPGSTASGVGKCAACGASVGVRRDRNRWVLADHDRPRHE
jgi:hypothetical protein